MITVWCSDFLWQREFSNDASARALMDALPDRPGCAARLLCLFSPSMRRRLRANRHKREALLEQAASHQMEAENWAKGREGEDNLARTLGDQLSDEYILLRNYTPPGPWSSGGDIDAVLLGPRGVIVFEVKAWTGDYLARGPNWFWRPGPFGAWEPALSNPTRQALRNADRVKYTLQAARLGQVQVRGMVAVASRDMRVYLEPPLGVYVFYACQDGASVRSLWTHFTATPLSPAERERVRHTLLPHFVDMLAL